MYLTQVRLKNIRCFKEEVVITLPAPSDDWCSWALILGDNGTGKSTLLRCIALGLCDETSASGLLRELSGELVRQGTELGEISLTLQSLSHPDQRFETHTTIHSTGSGNEELEQATVPESGFPWEDVFACGYGAAYGTFGGEVYEKYRLVDSLYTLFNYDARLQNPENALFRMSRTGTGINELLVSMNRVLMLPDNSIRLDSSGLSIHSPTGSIVPAGAIGDGYAATIAWLCDLFGWNLLAKQKGFGTRIEGLVLHDEIEQHLHPLWQRKLIGLLAEEFPGLQFFATTHAPLIAIGASALPDDRCQLILLEQEEDGVSVRSGLRPPRDLRADQVLTSYLFGLTTTTGDYLTSAIQRYDELRRKATVDSDEQVEIDNLEAEIGRILGTAETELQETARRAAREVLEKLALRAIAEGKLSLDGLEFETRRQLQEIFGGSKSER